MIPEDDDAPILLSREQVAKLLGISESHVKQMERRGVFPAVRLGVTVKYGKADILEVIDHLADEAKRKKDR
jgi:excisionase family DNA binding protein